MKSKTVAPQHTNKKLIILYANWGMCQRCCFFFFCSLLHYIVSCIYICCGFIIRWYCIFIVIIIYFQNYYCNYSIITSVPVFALLLLLYGTAFMVLTAVTALSYLVLAFIISIFFVLYFLPCSLFPCRYSSWL